MKNIICGVLCALLATGAYAERVVFTGSNDIHAWFIHMDSIQQSKNTQMFWLLTINIDPKIPYDTSEDLVEAECSAQRYRPVQSVSYLKGKVVATHRASGPWEYAVPGTYAANMLNVACKKYPITKEMWYEFSDPTVFTKDIQNIMRQLKEKK